MAEMAAQVISLGLALYPWLPLSLLAVYLFFLAKRLFSPGAPTDPPLGIAKDAHLIAGGKNEYVPRTWGPPAKGHA